MFDKAGRATWLSRIATVAELTWSSRWGWGIAGGCAEASWKMDLSPRGNHPALVNGSVVAIMDGPCRVWWGTLAEPTRGEPWELHAYGVASLGRNYVTVKSATPSTAVADAITLGLPWKTNNAALPTTTPLTAADSTDIGALMDWHLQKWGLFADGELVGPTVESTTPDWLLVADVPLMGTADDDFVTSIVARYVSAVDGATGQPSAWSSVTATNTAAEERWGHRGYILDLTPAGLLSFGEATAQAQSRLDQASARMGWTTALTASDGELRTPGWAPARLSQVRAGQMVRALGVRDDQGSLVPRSSVDLVLGEVKYSDGENSIYLAPIGLVPRSLSDVLAVAAAPEPEVLA